MFDKIIEDLEEIEEYLSEAEIDLIAYIKDEDIIKAQNAKEAIKLIKMAWSAVNEAESWLKD